MIHALQAAARAARIASTVLTDTRTVEIIILEDALIVRGWDRGAPRGEVRAVVEVTWLEFAANNDLVENAVTLVTDRLDRAVNG